MTFKFWIFIASVFAVSWALLIAVVALSIRCTLNFGIGLPHYFERRHGEDADDYSDDFHPSPDEKNGDLEKVSFPSASSDDAVIVRFPSISSPLGLIQRSESASSQMSQESRGSTRLPPLQLATDREVLRVIIPPPPAAILGRNLTASARSQTANSSFSPSWAPGDDRGMMTGQRHLQRSNTASSFGNFDSAQLSRELSFGTQASSNIIVSRTPTSSSNIIAPANTPQRSLTSSSKSSLATLSPISSPGRKRRIDLGEEM